MNDKKQNQESPRWYMIATFIMLAAGLIWSYSAKVNDNNTYITWSLINFATAAYCWMRYLKLKKAKQEEEDPGKKKS